MALVVNWGCPVARVAPPKIRAAAPPCNMALREHLIEQVRGLVLFFYMGIYRPKACVAQVAGEALCVGNDGHRLANPRRSRKCRREDVSDESGAYPPAFIHNAAGPADMNAILVQPISGPSVDPWRNERQAFGLELCLRLFFPR